MSDETILFLLPSLTRLGGGVELYGRQLVEAVAKARPGARLKVVLGREGALARPERIDAEVAARLEVHGAVSEARGIRIGEVVARAGLAAARGAPDLVVWTHANYAALGRGIGAATGAPVVGVLHGIEAWGIGPGAAAWGIRGARKVIAVSSFTAAQVVRRVGVDPERVVVVNNSVDGERFRPGEVSEAVERKLAGLGRPRLLTVARLDGSERYKGVDVVLRALAGRAERRRISYLVVGSGSDLPRLRGLAGELGVAATFFGQATEAELPELYRACDLFVMPSRDEGFGYVFIEALASGLPVIAGGADGSVDALAGGRLGTLVNPLDPEEVGRAIDAHVSGGTPAALRDRGGLRAGALERFGLDVFNNKIKDLLDQMLTP